VKKTILAQVEQDSCSVGKVHVLFEFTDTVTGYLCSEVIILSPRIFQFVEYDPGMPAAHCDTHTQYVCMHGHYSCNALHAWGHAKDCVIFHIFNYKLAYCFYEKSRKKWTCVTIMT
jgi:hypothetical protein